VNDVQSRADERQVDLQQVGIRRVELPWHIAGHDGSVQVTTAMAHLAVDLPADLKGTHMSRLVEVLEAWKDRPLTPAVVGDMLRATRVRLEASRAHLGITFTYFKEKAAPVSGQRSTMGYACGVEATISGDNHVDMTLAVNVPITTVCPCSKEISVAGAHNQRAWLRLRVQFVDGASMTFEEMITTGESLGSCEIYPLVKRADEKYVTERGYFNPKFVEDVVRDSVIYFRNLPGVSWFSVTCENLESIHNHSAWAEHAEHVAR